MLHIISLTLGLSNPVFGSQSRAPGARGIADHGHGVDETEAKNAVRPINLKNGDKGRLDPTVRRTQGEALFPVFLRNLVLVSKCDQALLIFR